MSQDKSDDKIYSLSELEKELQDAMKALEIIKEGGNVSVGRDPAIQKYEELKKKFEQKSRDYEGLEQQLQQFSQEMSELRQEKMMFEKVTTMTEDEKNKMQKARDEMKTKLETETHTAIEKEQEKMFLEKEVEIEHKAKQAAVKKYYKTGVMAVVAIAVIIGVYSFMFAELAGTQYQTQAINQPSGYVIQNLRGEEIDTWIAWLVPEGEVIRISVSGNGLTDERFELVKAVFLDEEPIEIDNSLLNKGEQGTTSILYPGWAGAMMAAAETPTEFSIPTKFEVTEGSGFGDINITLESAINPDGYVGWTSTIMDEVNNQILKASIKIYGTNDFTDEQLSGVLRHEVGHALGLAHSEDPDDLMAPKMTTEFPFISQCDVDTMVRLYDHGGKSEVAC